MIPKVSAAFLLLIPPIAVFGVFVKKILESDSKSVVSSTASSLFVKLFHLPVSTADSFSTSSQFISVVSLQLRVHHISLRKCSLCLCSMFQISCTSSRMWCLKILFFSILTTRSLFWLVWISPRSFVLIRVSSFFRCLWCFLDLVCQCLSTCLCLSCSWLFFFHWVLGIPCLYLSPLSCSRPQLFLSFLFWCYWIHFLWCITYNASFWEDAAAVECCCNCLSLQHCLNWRRPTRTVFFLRQIIFVLFFKKKKQNVVTLQSQQKRAWSQTNHGNSSPTRSAFENQFSRQKKSAIDNFSRTNWLIVEENHLRQHVVLRI